EVERLRREAQYLRAANAYVGRTAGFDGGETTDKVNALVALTADYPLTTLLSVARVARSTFFSHQSRLAAPDTQEALKAALQRLFHRPGDRYGHRRLRDE